MIGRNKSMLIENTKEFIDEYKEQLLNSDITRHYFKDSVYFY